MNYTIELCEPCRDLMLFKNGALMIDGFVQLPHVCPECNAKIASIVRVLLQPGAVVQLGGP
jgi:hypothetical protein